MEQEGPLCLTVYSGCEGERVVTCRDPIRRYRRVIKSGVASTEKSLVHYQANAKFPALTRSLDILLLILGFPLGYYNQSQFFSSQ
ncbi:hypothetical protein J6590_059281 [Homalodisca vitripennis]|nr:hypothetical protein J6590_059281 [Homalodisca vitripennis]